jgi:hypothetical protein
MNWNTVLIHASSVSKLFVEPQSKEAKLSGELSATAKTHLIETYIRQKYGRHKEIETKPMSKGKKVESDSLLLLSEHIGEYLEKNEDSVQNSWIIGTPDTYLGENLNQAEAIYDVKSSYDIFTFLANVNSELDKTYYYQIQSYLWLTGANIGAIAYCLVNNPIEEIEWQKQALMRKLNSISDESPEFKKAWAQKENLYIYDDIAENERILIFPIEKDPTFPEKCQQKVEKARQFLSDFELRHLNFNK